VTNKQTRCRLNADALIFPFRTSNQGFISKRMLLWHRSKTRFWCWAQNLRRDYRATDQILATENPFFEVRHEQWTLETTDPSSVVFRTRTSGKRHIVARCVRRTS